MRIESRFERAYYLTTCFVLHIKICNTCTRAPYAASASNSIVYAEKTTIVDK